MTTDESFLWALAVFAAMLITFGIWILVDDWRYRRRNRK